jgi:hypothetical protein
MSSTVASRWSARVRWLAVLPAAILGAFSGWLFASIMSLSPDPEGSPPASLFAATFIALLFVGTGAAVAPISGRPKIAVVLALAALEIAIFVAVGLRLGLTVRWPNAIANAVGAITAAAFTARPAAFESS